MLLDDALTVVVRVRAMYVHSYFLISLCSINALFNVLCNFYTSYFSELILLVLVINLYYDLFANYFIYAYSLLLGGV